MSRRTFYRMTDPAGTVREFATPDAALAFLARRCRPVEVLMPLDLAVLRRGMPIAVYSPNGTYRVEPVVEVSVAQSTLDQLRRL